MSVCSIDLTSRQALEQACCTSPVLRLENASRMLEPVAATPHHTCSIPVQPVLHPRPCNLVEPRQLSIAVRCAAMCRGARVLGRRAGMWQHTCPMARHVRVRGMACARTGHGMCRNRCCVLCIGRWHSSRRPGGSRAAVATMEAARSSELLSRGQGAPQPAASLAPLGDSFRTARHVAACCLAFRPEASQQLLSWQLWRSALQAEISAAWCAHAQCSPVSRALLSVITRLTLSGPSPTPTP